MTDLLVLLKRYFGYESFRPLQKEIIEDALAGRDTFALLPTGGGKSLCFQLPALTREGLSVVISPLIALMKDQVDALRENGIPATFLNSSLSPQETRDRWRQLDEGKIRLLYVAPERLMAGDFISHLKRWNVCFLAIDEAHCISEWGHDFRPEYRKLTEMREHFPDVPLMALTATATDRVRTDIVHLLKLKDPRCYVASFNRPNLTYIVSPKHKPYQQLLAFVEARRGESIIVYCQSRKSTEDVAEKLSDDGIKAKPYHAGLDSKIRSHHQELFLRDEVQVICATIAFGMGINKSNVRAVVHYDLPKNVEGYYQETGRAGRDGLPSDCLLLFNPGDAQKQSRFIDEKTNPQEQQIARRQLQEMVHFAETTECRRCFLLRYFGETAPSQCKACDNCLTPRAQFDGTLPAQKFLSCVFRIKQKSGFNVGLNHVVDVLRGANHEKIQRWQHEQLSTYGIGKEFGKQEWLAMGRELLRMGFLAQTTGPMATLQLSEMGRDALMSKKPIPLTKPIFSREKKDRYATVSSFDDEVFEHLRRVRKKLADEQNVPAYIIFSDATLRQMAAHLPETPEEFSRISGVGEKKQKAFGEIFIREMREILRNSNRTSPSPSLTVSS